jgi:hypothetical protein
MRDHSRPFDSQKWDERRAAIITAFTALANRVQIKVPSLVSQGTTSVNDVKPIDVVRTFGLPNHRDEDLVLSTMFRLRQGRLLVDTDIVQENGRILREIQQQNLGRNPTDAKLDAAADAVVDFAAQLDELVIEMLRSEGNNGTGR